MFRRSPRAALLGAAAILVAVVTAVLVVDSLASLRDQDRRYGRLHPVVVARRDLPVGTRMARADVEQRRVRGDAPEPGALRSAAVAVGAVVRSPLLAGAVVTDRHVVAARRSGLGPVLPAGTRAVRLVIEHGLRPEVGDRVDVLATFDPQTLGDGEDPTIVVATAVSVLAVDAVPDVSDTVAVTVLVDPEQSRRLAFSAVAGTLGLALAPPEAAR